MLTEKNGYAIIYCTEWRIKKIPFLNTTAEKLVNNIMQIFDEIFEYHTDKCQFPRTTSFVSLSPKRIMWMHTNVKYCVYKYIHSQSKLELNLYHATLY